jgi:hypothetical protein
MGNADFYVTLAVDAELRKLQWRMKLEDLRADRRRKQDESRRRAVAVRNAAVRERVAAGFDPVSARTRSAPRRRAVGLMLPRNAPVARDGPTTPRIGTPFRVDLTKMITRRRLLSTIAE